MGPMLAEINALEGVRGSAISTSDGMTVASELNARYRDDVVAGLASFLVHTTQRAMGSGDTGLRRLVVHATHGKLLVYDVGEAFLVVITDQFADLEQLVEQVQTVAERIRDAARIG